MRFAPVIGSEGDKRDGHVKGGPFEGVKLRCAGCGVDIWPRVGGYWYLLLAPRGRCLFPGVVAAESVLCSGCGRRAREALESVGIGPAAYRVPASEAKRFMTGP
jgi:hypothetical protein